MRIVNTQITLTYVYQFVEGDDVVPQPQTGEPFARKEFRVANLTPEAFQQAFVDAGNFRNDVQEQLDAATSKPAPQTLPMHLEEGRNTHSPVLERTPR